MTILLWAIFLALMFLIFIVLYVFFSLRNQSSVSSDLSHWLQSMSQRIDENNKQIDTKLSSSMSQFNQRLDKAAQTMQGVQKTIGEFSEIGRSMQQLQQYLQSPKLRGNIGEQILRELLVQSLPPEHFKLQYTFQSGEKVDAVIKTSQGLISIDSKFPMSNYREMVSAESVEQKENYEKEFHKDVRKHMKSISLKYILVNEGTLDYALMYIPSESIYYEIINHGELYDYAASQKVIPVSPLSFYAYLRVILISLEGMRIEQQAKEILSLLKGMKKDYEKTDEALSVLNKHVTNAYNQSSNALRTFSVLGQKLENANSLTVTERSLINKGANLND